MQFASSTSEEFDGSSRGGRSETNCGGKCGGGRGKKRMLYELRC